VSKEDNLELHSLKLTDLNPRPASKDNVPCLHISTTNLNKYRVMTD